MKSKSILSLALLSALTAGAFAQGSLTPPAGAPAPVYKTLDQVEARTPLTTGQTGVTVDANGQITISQPGSYYLTKNLVITQQNLVGITVNSDNVTVDLNGFTVSSSAAPAGHAITLGTSSNVIVRNGHIRGASFFNPGGVFSGIGWRSGVIGTGSGVRVSDLNIRGMANHGIEVPGSTVERCNVEICGNSGITAAQVFDSTAREIRLSAIVATELVNNSTGQCREVSSHGIDAANATVQNSRGVAVGGHGINAQTVLNSKGESAVGNGIFANIATNCYGLSSGGIGIQAITASYCVGTRTTAGGVGISANTAIACTPVNSTVQSPSKHLGTP